MASTEAEPNKLDNEVKPAFNEELYLSLTSQIEMIIDKSIKVSEEPDANDNNVDSTQQLAEQLHNKIIEIRQHIKTLPMVEYSIESIQEKQAAASQRLQLLNKAQAKVDQIRQSFTDNQ